MWGRKSDVRVYRRAGGARFRERCLHDWDLPTKRMLIGKAYAALPPEGALIVHETLIDK